MQKEPLEEKMELRAWVIEKLKAEAENAKDSRDRLEALHMLVILVQ